MADLKNKLVGAVVAASIGLVGAGLIKSSEGKVNAVYLDPVGIPTVCWGHTGPEVKMGQVWSDARCEQVLQEDIVKHQKVLYGPQSCIGDALKPGTNRMDAVTSFTFNVGTGNFCKSTMAKYLRAKNYNAASGEFGKWVYAKGRKLPGLVIRRNKEEALFNSKLAWRAYNLKEVTSR